MTWVWAEEACLSTDPVCGTEYKILHDSVLAQVYIHCTDATSLMAIGDKSYGQSHHCPAIASRGETASNGSARRDAQKPSPTFFVDGQWNVVNRLKFYT